MSTNPVETIKNYRMEKWLIPAIATMCLICGPLAFGFFFVAQDINLQRFSTWAANFFPLGR